MSEQIFDKKCDGTCGQTKPLADFYKTRNGKPMKVCNVCHKTRCGNQRKAQPKEARSAINRRHRMNNLANRKASEKRWYVKRRADGFFDDPERKVNHRANHRSHRQSLKASVFRAYGGFCACCGEDDLRLLTLDHLRNDGAVERRQFGDSQRIYARLKNENYPHGYQVLCFTCNAGRHIAGGTLCPHQLKVKELWSEFLGCAAVSTVA